MSAEASIEVSKVRCIERAESQYVKMELAKIQQTMVSGVAPMLDALFHLQRTGKGFTVTPGPLSYADVPFEQALPQLRAQWNALVQPYLDFLQGPGVITKAVWIEFVSKHLASVGESIPMVQGAARSFIKTLDKLNVDKPKKEEQKKEENTPVDIEALLKKATTLCPIRGAVYDWSPCLMEEFLVPDLKFELATAIAFSYHTLARVMLHGKAGGVPPEWPGWKVIEHHEDGTMGKVFFLGHLSVDPVFLKNPPSSIIALYRSTKSSSYKLRNLPVGWTTLDIYIGDSDEKIALRLPKWLTPAFMQKVTTAPGVNPNAALEEKIRRRLIVSETYFNARTINGIRYNDDIVRTHPAFHEYNSLEKSGFEESQRRLELDRAQMEAHYGAATRATSSSSSSSLRDFSVPTNFEGAMSVYRKKAFGQRVHSPSRARQRPEQGEPGWGRTSVVHLAYFDFF